MNILLQLADFVIVDKPCGWLTTPAREALDPRPVLGREVQTRMGQQIYPVHRLDFEVSGLVMFALNANAHRLAQKWFEHGSIVKTYEAMSLSAPSDLDVGTWVEWKSTLARGKRRAFEASHGKLALTRARVVEMNSPSRCKWELQPLTGRPHQLRFEMAKHGCPILGDTLYGGPAWTAPDGSGPDAAIALRAVRLDLRGVDDRLGLPEVIEAKSWGTT